MDYLAYLGETTLFILEGGLFTLKLYILTVLLTVPLSILLSIGASYGSLILKKILHIYAWIFRGTPLLLQLFFIYYGLPVVGINFPPFTAATLAFVLNYSAYMMEIFRSGIESIDKGQYEAAHALSMTHVQTMRRIILPQALRKVIPPSTNEAINLVKDSALVITIGIGDMLRSAKLVFTREFDVTPFIIAGILYLAITSLIVVFFRRLEKKLKLKGGD